MEKSKNEFLNLLWAKSVPFMSVRTHAYCAGICAQVFLTAKSNISILELLSNGFYADSKYNCMSQKEKFDSTVKVISYLVSLHDIGKIHPLFQSMNEDLYQVLLDTYPDSKMYLTIHKQKFHHEWYSKDVIRGIFSDQGYERKLRNAYASVLSLHHQRAQNGEWSNEFPQEWSEAQRELEKEMRSFFLGDVKLTFPQNATVVFTIITDILILSDWISSSFFQNAENMTLNQIKKRAIDIEKKLKLISDACFPEVKELKNMFPFIDHPRPLQTAFDSLSDKARLTIIEAPMGEGKTEAALYCAAKLCAANHKRGVYIAMPSQATSNLMCSRMNDMLKEIGCDESRLLHSMAFLNEEDDVVLKTEEEQEIEKWIKPTRMGFFGENAVGTIDQASASVLKMKFSILRLLGLTNKVLIIDEIHAYDTYSSTIIKDLLSWCSKLNIPVILLSATMRISQKKTYLSCYGIDIMPDEHYPLITQVLPTGEVKEMPIEATNHYYYKFRPIRIGLFNREKWIAQRAIEKAKNGGCVSVIVNTVRDTQAIFKCLREEAPANMEVLLFHSRYIVKDRNEIERRCIRMFGKNWEKRPQKAILIATQVVEQSLDLDFDYMISELAPIDLLLQRAGRLHRHREHKRPSGLEEPILEVLVPETSESDLEKRYRAHSSVYDPLVLFNTEQALKAERAIKVPEDIRSLVEGVYSDVPDGDAATAAWLQKIFKDDLEQGQALNVIYPDPPVDSFYFANMGTAFLIHDDDGFEASSEVSTRLGSETIRLSFCSKEIINRIHNEIMTNDLMKQIYLNSVSVPMKEPAETTEFCFMIKQGKLYGTWVVQEDKDLVIGKYKIKNNKILGVIKEKYV